MSTVERLNRTFSSRMRVSIAILLALSLLLVLNSKQRPAAAEQELAETSYCWMSAHSDYHAMNGEARTPAEALEVYRDGVSTRLGVSGDLNLDELIELEGDSLRARDLAEINALALVQEVEVGDTRAIFNAVDEQGVTLAEVHMTKWDEPGAAWQVTFAGYRIPKSLCDAAALGGDDVQDERKRFELEPET